MTRKAENRWICALLGAVLLCQLSCSNVSFNARQTTVRRPQESEPLTGSGNIALAVFRATAVAAVRQPFTTAKLGLVNLWHRPREVVAGNLPQPTEPAPRLPDAPGTWQFEQLLDRKKFPQAESGSLRWLVDGDQFFSELDRQIAAARRLIHIQLFIFDNDDIGVRYADRLKRRSREVPVRVLADDFGSTFAYSAGPSTLGSAGAEPPANMFSYLENDSKVKARRILDPWLTCDHTKLLVFDGHTAIIGGMNIGREYYSEWHDLMVRAEGPVVHTLERELNRAWRKAGPMGDFALFRKPAYFRRPQPVTGGIPLRVLRTDAAEGRYEILDSTLLAIGGARRRVWIENPYFGSDEIALAVRDAALRGVDVRVVLPAAGDSAIMDAGNLATAEALIRAGAKVYRYPRMTHMKVMICDDWASIGSANFDILSMRINRELNIAFAHPQEVAKLAQKVFLPDFKRSKRIRLNETRTMTGGLAEAIADQL